MFHYSKHLLSVLLLIMMTACTSSPVHYYTLVPPSHNNTLPQYDHFPYYINVLPVGIPAHMDTEKIIIRENTSHTGALTQTRWLSPLGDELQMALSSHLTQQLGTQDISGLTVPGQRPVMTVRIQIRRFEVWPENSIRLDADWSLQKNNTNSSEKIICHSPLELNIATADLFEITVAQQNIVKNLSSHIAAQMYAWRDVTTQNCISHIMN